MLLCIGPNDTTSSVQQRQSRRFNYQPNVFIPTVHRTETTDHNQPQNEKESSIDHVHVYAVILAGT